MSSQQYLDALASEQKRTAAQRRNNLILAVVAVAGMYFAWAKPKELDLHLSPDLKAGDTVEFKYGAANVPPPNVYSFAYYVWQQINRWQADGSKDYGMQIYNFQAYVTPSCLAQLQGDLQNRSNAGELRLRTRQLSEIPGYGFQDARVINESTSAWTVLLDMQVTEAQRGQPIKDTFVRYPLRVVRYDVDRNRNPFRLALDCFGTGRPARIDLSDAEVKALTKPVTVTPPDLPQTSALGSDAGLTAIGSSTAVGTPGAAPGNAAVPPGQSASAP
jgi:integrating conjugative element protein (TIGR03746 family)